MKNLFESKTARKKYHKTKDNRGMVYDKYNKEKIGMTNDEYTKAFEEFKAKDDKERK